MARVYVAALLVEHAKWSNKPVDAQVVNRWVAGSSGVGLGRLGLFVPEAGDDEWRRVDRILALVLYKIAFIFRVLT